MLIITTSRKTSKRARIFTRDLSHVIPGSKRVNRGKKSIGGLGRLAMKEGFRRILIVGNIGGRPSSLMFLNAIPSELEFLPVKISMSGVTLRKEMTKRRSPFMRRLGVAFTGPNLEGFGKGFSSGLGLEEPIELRSLDEGVKLAEFCDVALIVRQEDSSSIASFFSTNPYFELGPKMYLGGLRSVVNGGNPST